MQFNNTRVKKVESDTKRGLIKKAKKRKSSENKKSVKFQCLVKND